MHESLKYGKITNIAVDAAAFFAQHWGTGHELKPEGKPHFAELMRKVKAGEVASPTDNIHILDGFSYSVTGAEQLENQKGVLLLSNHSAEGPLRGYGNTLLIDYIFHESTQGEKIRWAQGHGSSVVDTIHGVLGKTMNTITVADGSGFRGAKELLKSLTKGESVGLYPEGVQKKELQKADPRAGKIILHAAKKGISIFCASSYFENGNFNLSINKLDANVLEFIGKLPDLPMGDTVNQHAADYAMIILALSLPVSKRGNYKNHAEALPSYISL